MADLPVRFVINSRWAPVVGFLLVVVSAAMLVIGQGIDWGVGWTTWVPAVILLIPAAALIRRRVVVVDEGGIVLESGWLWRRARVFPADRLELELLPTAGRWAVVLHRDGREFALATWLSRERAEALCAILDHAPAGPWPRRETGLPSADR
jgi:hypothetical protein